MAFKNLACQFLRILETYSLRDLILLHLLRLIHDKEDFVVVYFRWNKPYST